MESHIFWQIILQFVLIILNAIFACAEVALISLNEHKLAKHLMQGDKRALKLKNITSKPTQFLATIQVAITLSGFLASAFAADNFSEFLVQFFIYIGFDTVDVYTLDAIAVVIITLILSYFTLVFGELVPKRVAMQKADTLALRLSSLIFILSKITAPLVTLLRYSTNSVLRSLGINPDAQEEEITEEEIRMMVDKGSQTGVIQKDEKVMIQKVFEFDSLPVLKCMTHRTELEFLKLEDDVEIWKKTITKSTHMRFPICDKSMDDIIGVLNVREYFFLEEKTKENILKEVVKEAYFVPESIHADVLFRQMKQGKNHFSIVVDEYGGTVGIVTMNDLLEKLVGDFCAEESIEEQEEPIIALSNSLWRIKGFANVADVCAQLEITLPNDYVTFGGYILGQYGFIPDEGTSFDFSADGLYIRVEEIKDNRVVQALVSFEKNYLD